MSIGRFEGVSKDNFEIQKCHAVNLKVPHQIMKSNSKWQELKPTKKSETISRNGRTQRVLFVGQEGK